jgi:single-stranded DNA-binding protein
MNRVEIDMVCASEFRHDEYPNKRGGAPIQKASCLAIIPTDSAFGQRAFARVIFWGRMCDEVLGRCMKGDELHVVGRLAGRFAGDGPDGRGGKLFSEVVAAEVRFSDGSVVREEPRQPRERVTAPTAEPAAAETSPDIKAQLDQMNLSPDMVFPVVVAGPDMPAKKGK